MKRNRFQFITSIALIFMLCMSTVTPIFADTPITRVFAASEGKEYLELSLIL